MLSDCDEAKNEVIEASDLCPEAVEQFISYIHLDGIVQLDKFVDDLLALANKYEIEELKVMLFTDYRYIKLFRPSILGNLFKALE